MANPSEANGPSTPGSSSASNPPSASSSASPPSGARAAGGASEPNGSGAPGGAPQLWPRVLTVAWSSILLGLALEGVVLGIAAGYGTLKEAAPFVADTVRGVSWSMLVCVGVACGTAASKARPALMGALGLVSAPLAFTVSKALHKSMNQALSITAVASGPSPYLIAAIKGLEYMVLGVVIARLGRRVPLTLGGHLGAGAITGLVFGGGILGLAIAQTEPALAPVALATRAANELLFPIGCAFVLYVAEAFGRQASAPRR
ncbi:MAG: hypothetical protein IT453_16260 [Planctomycetes bacterium]|nr:hypothetical protein [Planctomycetota bacterium]